MRLILSATGLVCLVISLGCESSTPSTGQVPEMAALPPPEPAVAPPPDAPTEGQPPAPAADPDADAAEEPPAQQPTPPPAQPAPPAATPAPAAAPAPEAANAPIDGEGANLKKAEVGVGVKGKDYGGPGFVTTPVMVRFRAEERIVFEVQIPNAMKIYKAGHDNKGPKTHEEFMNVIIKPTGVQLPELAPGESYLYVPEIEELMVKSPKAQ